MSALAGRGEARGLGFVGHGLLAQVNHAHCLADGVRLFFRRQALEAGVGGQLDVDAESVGQAAGFFDQQGVGIRDGLEVNVTAEVVYFAQ